MYIDLAFDIAVKGKVYEKLNPDYGYSGECQNPPYAQKIDVLSQALVKISLSLRDKKYEVEGNAFDYKSTHTYLKEN